MYVSVFGSRYRSPIDVCFIVESGKACRQPGWSTDFDRSGYSQTAGNLGCMEEGPGPGRLLKMGGASSFSRCVSLEII